jgi:20S proteasome subunit alpha 6
LRIKQHELAFYQDKVFKISNNMGIGLCGLTADGSKQLKLKLGLLYKNLKSECLNYNYVYNAEYPTERLVSKIAESKQSR